MTTDTVDPVKQTNIQLPKSSNDILDYAKALGISKSQFVINALTFYRWFGNKAGWQTTKEATICYELTKAMREDLRQKGASIQELAKVDEFIEFYYNTLQRLEKKGDKP